MKKVISSVLAVMLVMCSISVFSVGASTKQAAEISFKTGNALYVHAVAGSNDADAWQAWQSRHDEDFNEIDSNVKYFCHHRQVTLRSKYSMHIHKVFP